MSLAPEDLKAIQNVVVQTIDDRLRLNNEKLLQTVDDRFRLNNDLLLQEIRASEARLEQKLDVKLAATEERILTGVAEILDQQVLPQIENLDRRVARLEQIAVST